MKNLNLIIFIAIVVISTYSIYPSAENPFKASEWKQSLIKHRKEKDIEFKTSPDSPMAGYKRITILKDHMVFLTIKDGKIEESRKKPERYNGKFYSSNNSWFFKRSGKSGITLLKGYKTLKIDKFTVKYYPLDDKLVLAIFDPDREKIKKFKHLIYYPPDIKYRVKAKLIKFKDPERISIPTSRKLQKSFFRYAKVKFQIDNEKLSLTVLKSSLDPKDPDSKYIFIPFADRTSGIETYAGGRFIEMEEPPGNELILDFNYCFNPLCNYADVYNCTLPPFENELPVEIRAGEKTYPH